MKNCGHRFHILVANRDFVDSVLVKIISPKNNPPTIVQDKVLALIQVGLRSLVPLAGEAARPGFLPPFAGRNGSLMHIYIFYGKDECFLAIPLELI